MHEHRGRARRLALTVIVLAAAAALVVGGLLFFSWLEKKNDPVPAGAGEAPTRIDPGEEPGGDEGPELPALFYGGKRYVYNDSLETLLILGIDDDTPTDSGKGRNSGQSDFLLLAVFDPASESCTLLQLDRNTMCEIPALDYYGAEIGTEYAQLALAHTYGNGLERSCENTAAAVSRLLYGIEIDNYFALTMNAIPILNDLVGGVTVRIEDDFSGIDDSLVKGETVTLTSENVEHYVRSRMRMSDDPTNRARMRRQRTYMTALFSALSAAMRRDSAFALDAYAAVADSLVTDCSVDGLTDYMQRLSDYTLSGVVTPEGETVLGEKHEELYLDEAELQRLVIETFYREEP
jgi:anionic cell wall polymer biosynthesis LytR-Cps2A-Psr (LCP) family protein